MADYARLSEVMCKKKPLSFSPTIVGLEKKRGEA
jgi:hypothetical protein